LTIATKRLLALIALGANAALAGVVAVVVIAIEFLPRQAEALAASSQQLARLSTPLLCVGALAFLPWLKATYRQAYSLIPNADLGHQLRRGPVMSFFVPFLNLVWPYQAVRALNAALDPDRVPAPAPRLAPDAPATYRDAPVEQAARRPAPPAPVRLWWALWIARPAVVLVLNGARAARVVSATMNRAEMQASPALSGDDFLLPGANFFVAFQHAAVCAAAIAAFVVVARISARLAEVARRLSALGTPASAPLTHSPAAAPAGTEATRDANWALGLAILSLFFCAPLTAPFAVWKASRALRLGASVTATAAIVLSVVGLVLSMFFWFLAIWQFLTPASPR
jgi:hypothetical protein